MDDDTSKQATSHSPRFREPLFWLAWVLLLICMFLPQGGFGFGLHSAGSVIVINGLELAIAAITLGPPLIILTLLPSLLNPIMIFSSPIPLVIAISMSDLLFIASPFILRRFLPTSKKMRNVWLVYALLNLVCVILLLLIILTMPIVGHIDPNNESNQLLPGFVVWVGAQVALTVAATAKL